VGRAHLTAITSAVVILGIVSAAALAASSAGHFKVKGGERGSYSVPANQCFTSEYKGALTISFDHDSSENPLVQIRVYKAEALHNVNLAKTKAVSVEFSEQVNTSTNNPVTYYWLAGWIQPSTPSGHYKAFGSGKITASSNGKVGTVTSTQAPELGPGGALHLPKEKPVLLTAKWHCTAATTHG
jgi:hypothetical protein